MLSVARMASSLSQNEMPIPSPRERSSISVKPLKPSAASYFGTTFSRTWRTMSSPLSGEKETRPRRAFIRPPRRLRAALAATGSHANRRCERAQTARFGKSLSVAMTRHAQADAAVERDLATLLGPDAVLPGDAPGYVADATEAQGLRGRADAAALPRGREDGDGVGRWG